MKTFFFGIFFLVTSFTSWAQADSLSISLLVNTPLSNQKFDLTRQYGITLGKSQSPYRFSLSYGSFRSSVYWRQFYDNQASSWTYNTYLLHDYSKNTPAAGKSELIYTKSHSVTIGMSKQKQFTHFITYASIGLGVVLNAVSIEQERFEAYIGSGYEGYISQGTRIGENHIKYITNPITAQTHFNSVVPTCNFELGFVYQMGTRFSLVPKLNWGTYWADKRLENGTLTNRGNTIGSDIRPAIQFTYQLL